MKKLFTLFIVLVAFHCDAQITFQKVYTFRANTSASSIGLTNDGGYIITGSSLSFHVLDGLIYLIRIDANGDTLWTKTYGGASEYGNDVHQTSDNGFIIVGTTAGYGYILKTNSNGDTLWSKVANGISFLAFQLTSDGQVVIAGVGGGVNSDIYLLKIDMSGNIVWTKSYGGPSYDRGSALQKTSDGGYVIAGTTRSFSVGGNDDFYLLKVDSTGNLMWSKTFGGANQDWGYYAQQTNDGGYAFTGTTSSFGTGNNDILFVKTDANGNLLWSKTYGDWGDDAASSFLQTSDGGFLIAGTTASSFVTGVTSAYLIKTDLLGNELWSKVYSQDMMYLGSSFIKQASNSGYIIACTQEVNPQIVTGVRHVYLIKTDSLGNSGCLDSTVTTTTTLPAIQVTSPATQVSSPATILTIPTVAVGRGGGISTICFAVGISETNKQENNISLSPNPTSHNLLLTLSNNIKPNTTLSIYNFLGAEVLTVPVTNSQTNINISALLAGVYLLNVKEGGRSLGVRKFVKM